MAAIHRRFELDVPGAGQRGVVDQTDGPRIFLVDGRADVAADEQAARAGHRYRARIDGAGGARPSARTDQGAAAIIRPPHAPGSPVSPVFEPIVPDGELGRSAG